MSFSEKRESLLTKIQNLQKEGFEAVALEVFRFQLAHNEVYRQYVELLGAISGANSFFANLFF